jgi:hypothetical protein
LLAAQGRRLIRAAIPEELHWLIPEMDARVAFFAAGVAPSRPSPSASSPHCAPRGRGWLSI